ncbi:MAG: S8 family peptidase [Candidatus Sedimenticola sp. (ex Thyasira tokunagai)]
MAKKNLLLGRGEELTRKIPPPKSKGGKAYPYSWTEAKQRLLPKIEEAISELEQAPDSTHPGGLGVMSMTLHPSFLAKSYFPSNMLKRFDLQCVGSKQILVTPEKTTKQGEPVIEASSDLYVSGSIGAFRAMRDGIISEELTKGVKNEITELEDLGVLDAESKIKAIVPTNPLLEVALHSPADIDIFGEFESYVTQLGGKVDAFRRVRSGGLTFVPVMMPLEQVGELAKFSMLRVVRSMPKLRAGLPNVARVAVGSKMPDFPENKAVINDQIRAAIFDGGVGNTEFGEWVREIVLGTGDPFPDGLSHGIGVTSAYLFGSLVDGEPLPVPYTGVDHYRVLDTHSDALDPHLYDVLNMISGVLASGEYPLANLSLGPELPVEDDDVSAWTSKLDEILSEGNTLLTVAVGNSGELPGIDGRIQPPSDAVNALSVGAANSEGVDWARATYSSKGPGRSPGFVKPDGISFGGSRNEPYLAYNPYTANKVEGIQGTSFASPNTMRFKRVATS